jgi:hypothetical protein
LLVLTAGCGGSDDKPAERSDTSKTADGWNRVVLGLVELEVPGDWEGSGHDGEDIQIWSRQRRGIGQFQALSRETTSEEMLADAKKNASDNGNTLSDEREVEVGELGTGYRFKLTLANGDVHDGLVVATIDGIAIDLLVYDRDEATPSATADRVFSSLKRTA